MSKTLLSMVRGSGQTGGPFQAPKNQPQKLCLTCQASDIYLKDRAAFSLPVKASQYPRVLKHIFGYFCWDPPITLKKGLI